jgi:hypothetical protein
MPLPNCIRISEQTQKNRSRREVLQNTATRFFVVEFDSLADTVYAEGASFNGVSIPVIGQILPADLALGASFPRFCISIEPVAEADSPGKIFWVQVDYSNQFPQDPLAQPAEVSWDFSDASENYFLDNSPTPKYVINSAGEPFEKLPSRETGSLRATVKKNVALYSATVAKGFKDMVNADGFALDGVSISSGQAKMKAWTCGSVQYQNGVPFRVATQVIDLRQTWIDTTDDRGFNEIDPNNSGKLKQIVIGNSPPTKPDNPWPLDGSGAAKPNASDPPAQLTFQPYATVGFSGSVYV